MKHHNFVKDGVAQSKVVFGAAVNVSRVVVLEGIRNIMQLAISAIENVRDPVATSFAFPGCYDAVLAAQKASTIITVGLRVTVPYLLETSLVKPSRS